VVFLWRYILLEHILIPLAEIFLFHSRVTIALIHGWPCLQIMGLCGCDSMTWTAFRFKKITSMFYYLENKERLSTKDNLFHRGIISIDSQLCLIGCGTIASVNHFFWTVIFWSDMVSDVALVRLCFSQLGLPFRIT